MIVYDKNFNYSGEKTFEEVLAEIGKSVDDIEKVYHGKDHWCRCGCGGNYFYNGVDKAGYTRAINKMKKPDFKAFDIESNTGSVTWINIPDADRDNMCYCIYFKKEEK